MVTDQADLQAASQEASTKTQVDAIKTIEEGLVNAGKTMQDMNAETQELQSAFSALSISNFVITSSFIPRFSVRYDSINSCNATKNS